MEATQQTVAASGDAAAEQRPWPADWPANWDGDDRKLWNREQTARALNVSLPTFDRMRRDGLPFRREGSNGRSYGFYMPEVWTWREGVEAEAEDAKRQKEDAVAQAQLALVGGNTDDPLYRMKPQERRQAYEAELSKYKVARERRELIPVDEMRHAQAQVFATMNKFLQSLPESLGRELGWDLTQIALCQDKVDQFQERLARLMMEDGGRDGPVQ